MRFFQGLSRRAALSGALAGAVAVKGAHAALSGVIPVLTYHRFDPAFARASTVVTTSVFAGQIDALIARHFRFLRVREVVAAVAGQADFGAGDRVALSADDGWRTVYTEMFPVIRQRQIPVTLFINPPAISAGSAYLTWAQIEEMVASGLVDVHPHTLTHPNFGDQRASRTQAAFAAFAEREILESRRMIEARLGGKADILAWPFGIHDSQLEAIAATGGFSAAFTVESRPVTAADPMFALPRYQVYETDRGGRFAAVADGVPRGQGRRMAAPRL